MDKTPLNFRVNLLRGIAHVRFDYFLIIFNTCIGITAWHSCLQTIRKLKAYNVRLMLTA